MYRVWSVGEYGTDEIFSSVDFAECKKYADERSEGDDGEYVVYDKEGIIVYETYSKSFGNYGVMGC